MTDIPRQHVLSPDEAAQLIELACPDAEGTDWAPERTGASPRAWPDAFLHVGLVPDSRGWWLWLRPRDGIVPGGMEQLVMDLPGGRYLVDTFDTVARAWVLRESAAATPLVFAVPLTKAPLVVHIHPVAGPLREGT